MSRIHFTPRPRRTAPLTYWSWRTRNRRASTAHEEDKALYAEFAERACEIGAEMEFLLGASSQDGAEVALAAFAEEDMNNFCVMVDLAEPIEIDGTPPLTPHAREGLQAFLAEEPWRSLAVDVDITIALAVLDNIGTQQVDAPWYRYAPGFVDVVASVLDRVNLEQYERFLGEYRLLQERDHLRLADDVADIFATLLSRAAQRLGTRPPEFLD